MINFFALISLAAAIVNVTTALFVFSRNPKGTVNRLFALFFLSLAWWGILEMATRLSSTADDAMFWLSITVFGFTFMSPLGLHFVLFYVGLTSIARNLLVIAALYVPPVLWLFPFWQTSWIIQHNLSLEFWGWDDPPGKYFWVFVLWLVSYFFVAIFLLLRFVLRTKSGELKTQALILLICLLIPILSGIVTDVILPILRIPFPDSAVAFSTIGALFVSMAILRYRLFAFSPEMIATEIIDSMNDALFVLNERGEIQSINPGVAGLLGFGERALIGVHFTALFPGRTNHARIFREEVMAKLTEGQEVTNFRSALRSEDEQDVLVSISAAPIAASQGRNFGFVLVARDVRVEQRLIDELEENNRGILEAKARLERLAGELLRRPRAA